MASYPGAGWGGGYPGQWGAPPGYGGYGSYGGGYGSPGGGNRKRGRDGDDGYGKRQRLDIDAALPSGSYDRPFRRGPRYSGGPGNGSYPRREKYDRDVKELLSVGDKYCIDLWRFGDEVPGLSAEETSRFTGTTLDDFDGLKAQTCEIWSKGSREDVVRGFRIAIAECPHKLQHFATLLALLAEETLTPKPAAKPASMESEEAADADMSVQTPTTPAPVNIGVEIVKDLVKSLQNHLDGRRWRSVRFTMLFLAHLASLLRPLVAPESLLATLQQSFVTVLENEPGLRAARGDELVRIVLETLLLLRPDLRAGDDMAAIANGIQNYLGLRKLDLGFLGGDSGNVQQWLDPIELLFQTLNGSSTLPQALATPYQFVSKLTEPSDSTNDPYQLPLVSLPIESESDGSESKTSAIAVSAADTDFARDLVGYAGVRAHFSLFTDDTVPEPRSADGFYIRQTLADVISVYEVNRKECARILLQDVPKWFATGTIKSATASAEEAATGPQYNYENIVMEVILSELFSTPSSPHKAVYYQSLIGELCKVSPQTVAPALGKCIRKLYAGLGQIDGTASEPGTVVLGPEGLRRYAEWFAIHLSNFGFHWRWPEWEADLALPHSHPKKVFIARVIELEIRLSYYDRIKSTLPESYTASGDVIARHAPSHSFTYETDGRSPYQVPANDVLRAMRSKATVQELKDQLQTIRTDAIAGEIGDEPISEEAAERLIKDIVYQCMLVVGSRSFSHFLNILERYIALLREFTAQSADRLALLRSVSRFWTENSQFSTIVFDKLLQYRIVDPIDVVGWVFGGERGSVEEEDSAAGRDWSSVTSWDILRMTLEKVQTRVINTTARLQVLRKREEDRVDAEAAAGAEVVEGDEAASNGAAEVAAAEKQLANLQQEQANLLVEVVRQFLATFAAHGSGSEQDEWARWFARGWFAEFCRAFAKDIARYIENIGLLEIPSDGLVYQGLQAAQIWVEFA